MFAFTLCYKGSKGEMELTLDSSLGILSTFHGLVGGMKLSYKDGNLVFSDDKVRISAEGGEDVKYEIDLKSFKKNEMRLRLGHSFLEKEADDDLKSIVSKKREIDIKDFVKNYAGKNEGNLLYRYSTDTNYQKYNTVFEIYNDGDMLYIKRFKELNPKYEDQKYERRDPEKSRIEDIIINNQISFNMNKNSFAEVMKEIYENGYEFTMAIEEYMIRGHAITVPCLEVCADDFMVVFDSNHVLEVHFAEQIMDNSYYTNTRGEELNVGELVRKHEKKDCRVQIEGYGADNVWHYVYDRERKYVYALGFCV